MNTRTGRTKHARSNNKKSSSSSVGEEELEVLLDLAQYELEQDPYRGMLSLNSLENNPWTKCLTFVDDSQVDNASSLSALHKVFSTCHCACPSLVHWTEQQEAEQSKRRNKRKRNKSPAGSDDVLGHRPSDADFECACDYNPFCLGSLGGVMDELLERVAKQLQQQEEVDSIESQSQASSQQKEVIDIDGIDSVEERKTKRQKPSPPLEFSYSSDHSLNIIVESGKHKASGVYQKEIKAEQMELDPEHEHAIYSPVTAEQMKQVRKTAEIDMAPVKVFVKETILSHLNGDATLTYKKYMDALRKWHDSLSFSNPLLTTEPANGSDKITISIPPGIKNLGATCYLNTQFQCLARIPAFLNGIFSWTPSDENHQMNSVLSTMQLLFTRMAHGSEATLTTQEFSTALGLENDEMQDPNEFGRLLMERMHESFQQCAGQEGGQDLSQLLPKLFHGVTTYETVCLTCQNITERSEGFMDLNLPIIVQSNNNKDSKKSPCGQQKITDTFVGGTSDTNVQQCLDEYTCAEGLSGDNQYSCECCQAKRDARRRVTFRELPPVLNVQLSRYVFDRKKFVKKKLTDKVLLPRVLMVPVKGTDTKRKYLLCAVMKHRGTSAYSGHYIAEAMDWQTGTWFEFNDQTVTVLDGPSCSYKVEELDTMDKKEVKGSQDAYNMYYVEEGFLAECASNSLTARAETGPTSVLAQVAKERENRYSMLTEMCLNDGKVACRLMRRKVGLTTKLSNVLSSQTGSILFNREPLVPGNESCSPEADAPVWVEADILRRFFSCNKAELGSIISTSGPLLKHKHLLCEHEAGLHPRTARRGKFLPRPLYNALVSLMLGERRMLNGEDESTSEFDADTVNDCIITPDQNMYCEICAESYKAELRQKIDSLVRLRQLSQDLDSRANKIEIDEDSSDESDENKTIFLVSSKFATKFRGRVAAIMKTVAATSLQSQAQGKKNGSGKAETYCGGLDSIDLFDFDPSSSSDELDRFVNSAITCEHGNISLPSARSVRRVSGEVWTQLLSFFPNAIRHQVRNDATNQQLRCERCENEETNDELFSEKLRDWGKAAATSPVLRDIAKRKRTYADLTEALIDVDSDAETFSGVPANDLYLVHRKDVESWRTAVKALKKSTGKVTSASVEHIVGRVFSCVKEELPLQSGRATLSSTLDVKGHILGSMSSLMCVQHGLPLERTVLKADADQTNPCVALANNFVEPFTPIEYAAFIGSIYDLGILLSSLDTGNDETGADESELHKSPPHVTTSMLRSLQKSKHPRLQFPFKTLLDVKPNADGDTSKDTDDPFKYHYSDGICRDKDCNDKFDEEQKGNDKYPDEAYHSNEAGHVDVDLVTCDDDASDSSMFPLRIFQIAQGAELDTVVSSILGLPRAADETKSTAESDRAFGSLRRSSRRRKTTYPSGSIMREDSVDVHTHYNIAAVRLFLYEKYSGFPLDRELTLIVPRCRDDGDENAEVMVCADENHIDMTMAEASSDGKMRYVPFELPYAWNEKSLQDIVEGMIEGKDVVPKSSLKKHLRSEIFLCWRDPTSNGKKKGAKNSKSQEEEDTPVPHETLMEGLLELTNASSGDTPTAEKKKSTRRAERGFAGTLLHSLSSAPNSDEAKKSDEGDSTEEKKENQDTDVDTLAHVSEKDDSVDTVKAGSSRKLPAAAAVVKAKESRAATTAARCSQDVVVVVDDSDDDDPPVHHKNNGTTHQNHQSDDDLSVLDPPDEGLSVLVSTTSHQQSNGQGNRRRLRSSILSPMEEETLNSVVSCLSDGGSVVSSILQSQCREAVRWAINQNPDYTISQLTDAAIAKYLDGSN